MEPITKNVLVNAEVSHVYDLWTRFEDFPKFMKDVESVRRIGEGRTHWVMIGPLGRRLEWDAETTSLDPDKRVAWNSLDGGDVKTSGQVLFNSLPNGQTAITATIQYAAGTLTEVFDQVFHRAESVLEDSLNSFKRMAELNARSASR